MLVFKKSGKSPCVLLPIGQEEVLIPKMAVFVEDADGNTMPKAFIALLVRTERGYIATDFTGKTSEVPWSAMENIYGATEWLGFNRGRIEEELRVHEGYMKTFEEGLSELSGIIAGRYGSGKV